jgi:hypothetical protein
MLTQRVFKSSTLNPWLEYLHQYCRPFSKKKVINIDMHLTNMKVNELTR